MAKKTSSAKSPPRAAGRAARPQAEKPTAAGRPTGTTAKSGVPMVPPVSGVTVRMYRTGLGDCFLLCFPRADASAERDAFFILIDCGVFASASSGPKGTAGEGMTAGAWIREIAKDIAIATRGHIDIVMITHEHWDHVSGFHAEQARAEFGAIAVGAKWMPWTEDMSNDLARKLKQEGGAAAMALCKAAEELERRGMAGRGSGGLVHKVLGFFGVDAASALGAGAASAFGAGKYSVKSGDAMKWVQQEWSPKAKTTYLHPGDGPVELPGTKDARIYVLGPPEDERVIKVLDRAGASYRMGMEFGAASACFLAFGVVPEADGRVPTQADIAEARRMSIPFGEMHQLEVNPTDLEPLHAAQQAHREARAAVEKAREAARGKRESAERALKAAEKSVKAAAAALQAAEAHEAARYPLAEIRAARQEYRDLYLGAPEWRRIGEDWAEPAGAFALQLDSKTNNTSLAFALEVGPPGKGKVLLFPGDAQIGNWLSWFGPVKVQGADEPVGKVLSWTVGGRTITAEDLLRRTVLYKVGHHGSHNATLRTRDGKPSGLQFMGGAEGDKSLVALIPVDEYVARNKAGYGDMPLPNIVGDLLTRTEGRVARNDEDAVWPADEAPTLAGQLPAGTPPRKADFDGKRKCDLFIEYDVL